MRADLTKTNARKLIWACARRPHLGNACNLTWARHADHSFHDGPFQVEAKPIKKQASQCLRRLATGNSQWASRVPCTARPLPGEMTLSMRTWLNRDGNAATRSELAEIAADVNGNPHWDCSAWIGRMRLWAIPARTGREQRQIITRFGRTQPLTAATRIDASNRGSLAAASGDAL